MSYALNTLSGKSVSLDNEMSDRAEPPPPQNLTDQLFTFKSKVFHCQIDMYG